MSNTKCFNPKKKKKKMLYLFIATKNKKKSFIYNTDYNTQTTFINKTHKLSLEEEEKKKKKKTHYMEHKLSISTDSTHNFFWLQCRKLVP